MAAAFRLRWALLLVVCFVAVPASNCKDWAQNPVQQAGQLDTGEDSGAAALLEPVPGFFASTLCNGKAQPNFLFVSSVLETKTCLL